MCSLASCHLHKFSQYISSYVQESTGSHMMLPSHVLYTYSGNGFCCHIGSCHNLSAIARAIRSYLKCEWDRKVDETGKPSVPANWAAAHPGMKYDFSPTDIVSKTAQVPRQDNWWDCGLFVLAYLDFWTHAPPEQVELCGKAAFRGKSNLSCNLSSGFLSCP